MANLLTLIRVALIFVVVGVWARQVRVDLWVLDLVMVPLLGWAIFMDALDGWVARRFKEESDAGAMFDIAGDRIVEMVLWIFFAIRSDDAGRAFVPYWVPLIMVARTVLTDFVRSLAFRGGRTPFGDRTMQTARWARELTASRWSRAVYGILKAAAFCALGIAFAWDRLPARSGYDAWRLFTDVLVYGTVALGVARGVPVLWEGRHYLSPREQQSPDEPPAAG